MVTSSYDNKRHFDATPEPPAEHGLEDVDPFTAPAGVRFVIQQHHATALHHDLRLEMLNEQTPVLVSWAVPKGLPRRRGQRHLAIRTEDHPMAYATFSGTIPEEEYGGGQVRIFDDGEYELIERSEDRITFRLDGRRLEGIWHLVHTGPKDGRDQWLAIMREDLRPPGDPMPPPTPMVPDVAPEPFDDPEWGFEPRWPGVRAILMCTDRAQLLAGEAGDVTDRFPELGGINRQVVALDAMVDGVIVGFIDGKPSGALPKERIALTDPGHVAEHTPSVFMAFDILYIDGADITVRPLRDRRGLLEEVVVPSDRIQISPLTEADGVALSEAAAQQGFDGIVAKRLTSPYQPGRRSNDWLVVDHPRRPT